MPKTFKAKNVLIIGIGLIGSSIALALRKHDLAENICIYDSNAHNSEIAIENKIGDFVYTQFDESIHNFDIIFFCTPLSAYDYICEKIIENITSNNIITDVGSVKANPIDELFKIYDNNNRSYLKKYFIPTHPIAGTENSGPLAGFDSLFENKKLIITENAETSKTAKEKIAYIWQTIGCNIVETDALAHDKIYAKVSHVVQLACSSYVAFLMSNDVALGDLNQYFFKDFVRIAGSDAKMWTDIFLYNKENILEAIDLFLDQLSTQNFESAIEKRNKIAEQEPQSSVLCSAKNRYLVPVIISSALINLLDDEILPFASGAGLVSMTKNLSLYNDCNDYLKVDLGGYVNELLYFKELIEKEDDITLMNHLTKIRKYYLKNIKTIA